MPATCPRLPLLHQRTTNRPRGQKDTTMDKYMPAERDESGMTTAELLGNAALGVAALVTIWVMLQALGVNIIEWMRDAVL
jgi:hypothetical protein